MNSLHDSPDDTQATHFRRKGVNSIGAPPHVAKETFNRIRTANIAMCTVYRLWQGGGYLRWETSKQRKQETQTFRCNEKDLKWKKVVGSTKNQRSKRGKQAFMWKTCKWPPP